MTKLPKDYIQSVEIWLENQVSKNCVKTTPINSTDEIYYLAQSKESIWNERVKKVQPAAFIVNQSIYYVRSLIERGWLYKIKHIDRAKQIAELHD